jgi:hypothetical protein
MPMSMILTCADITESRKITIGIYGETFEGICIGQSKAGPLVRWSDGSVGQITDSFLRECDRLSIDFRTERSEGSNPSALFNYS